MTILNDYHFVSQCSVSCGEGVQVRGVECTPAGGGCDPATRPEISRPCSTGISCPAYREAEEPDVRQTSSFFTLRNIFAFNAN